MRSIVIFLFITFFSSALFGQKVVIQGKITNSNGQSVPFASVFEKNTSIGTSANSEGEFQLKLDPGVHTLIFKAIGFSQESRDLNLQRDQVISVVLKETVYQLKDVIVRTYSEDPAYEVIRNAIKQRNFHLNEIEQFTAGVYIKGMQKLLGAPKKFLGANIDDMAKQIGLDSNRKGILYLSESESKLSYIRPRKYREVMISSKVSGSNRAFSFNRASDMEINFYQNLLELDELSPRPFISPIADQALFYYNYKLVGTSMENGQMINKIELIPKRSADPVFRGIIYIIEDSWRIHSADLYLTKEANIQFVDTLNIRQEFIPINAKTWMPSTVRFDFTGGFLGFDFGGYFIALYTDYDLNPGLNPKDFREVLNISREVNKKDTSYWKQARPIPLTLEEQSDYVKKEILAKKRESKEYLDSLDKVNNKFKPIRFLIGSGYNPRNRFKKEYYQLGSLINSLFYNTVEGFGLNYKASYSKRIDSLTNKFLRYTGKVRYGLSSEKLYASFSATIPLENSSFVINAGSDVLDLNNLESISQLANTTNSLYYERNLLKLYESRFVNLSYSKALGSVKTSISTEWSNRRSLQNTSDYTIRNLARRDFTSNNPLIPVSDLPMFPENQALKLKFRASYAFSNDYSTYPSGKSYNPSKYPSLGINYESGVHGIFGSDVDYSRISVDLTKSDIKLGLLGQSAFWLGAGKFLSNNKLFFMDYKHFLGTQTLAYTPYINSFLYLDYYNFSTPDRYWEAHFEHNFSGFLLNKIPLLRKLKLNEIAGFNYLGTPAHKSYSEFYLGISFLNFRASYGWSYLNGKRNDFGFRIATGL